MQLCVVVSMPCFDCLLPVPRPFCAHCNYTLFTGATELTSYPKVVVANFFLATFTCNPWSVINTQKLFQKLSDESADDPKDMKCN